MAINATPGAQDANAYITVERADELITTSKWTELTIPQKEAHIKKATTQIDTLRFFGTKRYTDQALQFPRYERDDDIPTKVEFAVAEQIIFNLDGGAEQEMKARAKGITSKRIGDVAETYSTAGSTQDMPIAGMAHAYLRGIISRVGKIIR